eukprot:COSAG02_NODE_1654_length_11481_cov_3.465033_4_plen_90_part_00
MHIHARVAYLHTRSVHRWTPGHRCPFPEPLPCAGHAFAAVSSAEHAGYMRNWHGERAHLELRICLRAAKSLLSHWPCGSPSDIDHSGGR